MLLQDLIRIPSVNPDNAPGTGQTHEEEIAMFLRDHLAALGAEVVLEEIQPRRPNLIARFAPLDGRPRILFGPHLDTVGVENMTIEPFSGELRDGRIWGRGASDTKGSMAAMIEALAMNRELLAEMPTAIDFVAFMGEESGQFGSKHFAKHHGHDYQFAVVGEPTSMDVVHTTKGSAWITLEAYGVATHSSQPHLGENAILKLTAALHELQERLEPLLATFSHPILGQSTINIGVISGGSRPNIVPDLARAEIDIRLTPSLYEAGGAVDLVRKTIEEVGLPVRVVRAHENPPMETAVDHPMIRKLLASLTGSSTTGAPWFSDAAHLADAGVPSVCVGPGSINQAHTKDEFLELAEYDKAVAGFACFIRSLADG